MEAKHLRIGNLAIVFKEIKEITPNDLNYILMGGKDVKPIPLTEEWLLKLGFTLDIGVGVWFSTQKHFPVWAAYGDKPYQYTLGSPSHNINISSVHQLQNLFFSLCGEELQLK